MKTFEYCGLSDREIDMGPISIEQINQLGKEGWELCAIKTVIAMPSYCIFYFKKELEANKPRR